MDALRSIVLGVIRDALRERGLSSIVLLRSGSPGHALVSEWLGPEFTVRVEDRAPPDRRALVLDPAPKDVVLLEGPLPGADVLPLGDVWSSRIEARDLRAAPTPLEQALTAAFEGGRGLDALDDVLDATEARSVRRRILTTAPLLRPPVVPKVTEWTIGIDPGP